MKNSIRVALPGVDALKSTNPDDFALYTDEDWVLIKENVRGSVSINAGFGSTITHGLGYVPFFSVYANGFWSYGYDFYGSAKVYATTTTLEMINTGITTDIFEYYIFYDNQV